MSRGDEILARVARGDLNAMQDCMHRYGGLIWSLANRLAPGLHEAEDVVQEIFMDLWHSAGRFDPERATETTFVATIARRRLIDRYRSASRGPTLQPLEAASNLAEPMEQDRTELADDLQQVHTALAQLRPEQREILELCLVRGLTHREIAERTGLALGTVKSHARRGLARVREVVRHQRAMSDGATVQ